MKKAIFLFLLFSAPLIWLLSGDELIRRFFAYVYLPIGSIYTIFIWVRPANETMALIFVSPVVFLFSAWVMNLVGQLISADPFSVSLGGLLIAAFASAMYLCISFFHVLAAYGIYCFFLDQEWIE